MKVLKFIAPLYVEIKSGKKTINLNYYRNWHYRIESQVKKEYQDIITQQLFKYKNLMIGKCKLQLTLFKKSKVQKDKSNFLSIHEKYFCDALVENNILLDDSDDYILSTQYCESIVDKNNPRVEIVVIVLG